MSGVRLLDFWSGPSGAGAPVACLATTFTFEADFFTEDCLSRFLGLSTISGEGDRVSTVAAVLEEEDRLSEAQITVLVDRSSPAEKRNLRWDLLPVSVPGGLLHAKVAVLLWENHCRVVLGSANLTSAGYRRQVEFGLALDIADGCQLPRQFLDDLHAELVGLAELAAGDATRGPKARALDTLAKLAERIEQVGPPTVARAGVRLALAPARPGVKPLEQYAAVWHGVLPTRATMLSPFWDDVVPAPAILAVRRLIAGRTAERRSLTLVAAIDPHSLRVKAPRTLSEQPDTDLVTFAPPDHERRALHAKLVLLESDDWVAAMVGSSNATTAGLGLSDFHGHREINVWIGCARASAEGKALRALASVGNAIVPDDQEWDETGDEDEPKVALLPPGFVDCVIKVGPPPVARLTLRGADWPAGWTVADPAGHHLLDSTIWSGAAEVDVPLPGDAPLPAYLLVSWSDDEGNAQAMWTANLEDRAALPPPAELSELSVEVLLAALASTRPLPIALEQELRRGERATAASDSSAYDDPLRRFHSNSHLLQRVRHVSLALWRLQERLGRPASTLDALRWRLGGVLGPIALAEGIVRASGDRESIAGEAHFLLAELARTVAAVDWPVTAAGLNRADVDLVIAEVLQQLRALYPRLPAIDDGSLDAYVRDALEMDL